MKKLQIISFFLSLIIGCTAFAQTENRFEKTIQGFEQNDQQKSPPANPILFTGSSSIVFWKDLDTYFPNRGVLNRGFGGSTLTDVRHFADRVIVRYKPRQIVLYVGENDIAGGKTGQQTYEQFVDLFRYVRQKLGRVPIVYIAMKPSPSRRKFWPEIQKANQLIRSFLSKERKTDFVDVWPLMLTAGGQPIPELYRSDSLHMTDKGYQVWAPAVRPYLLR